MSHYTVSGIFVSLAVLTGCSGADTASEVKTNLGPVGNNRVASTFELYKAKREHCDARGTGRRVILTGFGLFEGANYNISGTVVSSFADPAFVPDNLDLRPADATDGGDGSEAPPVRGDDDQGPVADGVVNDSWHGGIARNRSMTINGQPYEICFLTLDVLWDLAASIIVDESGRFQPEMVMMTGRGRSTATFETAAVNQAYGSGYNSDGSPASYDNTAVKHYVLPSGPAQVDMTWDNEELYRATRPLIASMGYESMAASGPTDDNNYICNNVSYVMVNAAQQRPITLAGNLVRIDPDVPSSAKVGFFHFPDTADNSPEHVATWVKVMATAISANFGG